MFWVKEVNWLIKCQNVSVRYSQEVKALDQVSFRLEGPTITGIIGPNGAGKSTLLKAILNIIPSSGKSLIDGSPSISRLKNIAYVEQKSAIDYTFPITVSECVSLGTYPRVGLFHRLGRDEWHEVHDALEAVGLEKMAKRQISELSGGQFQRILIARCLVQDADFIFLDEPFVGIDSVSEEIIMGILRQLKQTGKTILIVHHDLNKVRHYFDQVLLLNRELIAVGPVKEAFTTDNLYKAYGQNLLTLGGESIDR